jgi:hypothetical protein
MPIIGRWTSEALHRAWLAGVSRFFWFGLRDPAPDPSRPFSETVESGLYYRGATLAEDRPKPHLTAFRFPFVAYPRGRAIRFWGRAPNSGRGRIAVQLRGGGRWRTLAEVRAGPGGIFRGQIGMGHRVRRRGLVRAVQRSERSLPFSLRPVRDFHQPPFG